MSRRIAIAVFVLLAVGLLLALRPEFGPTRPDPPDVTEPAETQPSIDTQTAVPAAVPRHALRVRTLDPLGRPVTRVRLAVRTGTEDLAGAIADPAGEASFDLPEGRCHVVVEDAEWYGVSRPIDVPEAGTVTICVGKGLPLSVRAEDDAGAPVAGARILVDGRHTALTDEDGLADLGAVDPGGVWVRVESDRHVHSQAYVRPARTPKHVARLARGGRLVVRVTEDAGSPVRDAHLFIVYDPGRILHVDADERGVAIIPGMAAAPAVTIDATTRSGRRTELKRTIEPGTKEQRVEIRMPAGEALAGIVVESATGIPIRGASIHTWDSWGRHAVVATTDADGRFRFRGSDRAGLGVTAPGFALLEESVRGERVEMVPAARLRGRILSHEGAPVPGTGVVVMEGTMFLPALQTRSGPDGRFEIGDIPPEEGWVRLYPPGRPRDTVHSGDLFPGETRDLGDIRLSRLFTLNATVADNSGRPVPLGWIEVTGVEGTRIRRPILGGQFVPIPNIRREGATAVVVAPGLLTTAMHSLEPGTDHIVLERPCSISGRLIRKGTNLPVPNVAIVVELIARPDPLPSGWFRRGRTDELGSFRVDGLCRGRFLVIVKSLKVRGEITVGTGHRDVGTITVSE